MPRYHHAAVLSPMTYAKARESASKNLGAHLSAPDMSVAGKEEFHGTQDNHTTILSDKQVRTHHLQLLPNHFPPPPPDLFVHAFSPPLWSQNIPTFDHSPPPHKPPSTPPHGNDTSKTHMVTCTASFRQPGEIPASAHRITPLGLGVFCYGTGKKRVVKRRHQQRALT